MKVTSIILVLLVSLGNLSFSAVAQKKQWLAYEPATVELEGTLVTQDEYGPPNYGENPRTDQKVKILVLVLAKPINVRGTPGDANNALSVEGTRRIQLTFGDAVIEHKELIGKKVVVKGSLFHALTGHHYTAVVMTVSSLERKTPAAK